VLHHLSRPSLFCSGYFGDRDSVGPGGLTRPAVAGMTGAQLFLLRWGLQDFFAKAGLEPGSYLIQPPKYQDYSTQLTPTILMTM
jgi:hypothetical protein